jgi:primosomal replication protein N
LVADNQVELCGDVIEREALRFTPAGIAVLALRLRHESTQVEAKMPRQVQFEIDAMAAGETAQRMDAVRAGQRVRLHGFIASRSRLSTRIVLHVNQFELE